MSVLIVGSIAIDNIRTQTEQKDDLLGGSASYASVAASFFDSVNMVGIVGTDFPKPYRELFINRGVNLEGLEVAEGKTFRWTGEYEVNMDNRRTLNTELNVFETYQPKLPQSYRSSQLILLGNISPALQLHVLDQVDRPGFVVADTMNLWIDVALEDLNKVLKRIDLLVINDSEASQLTKKDNLIQAGRAILQIGPKYVAIKKGAHGCLLLSQDQFFSVGAYPLEHVKDPTGAGDCFAGAFAGYLGSLEKSAFDFSDLKKAVVYGSLLASFSVEAFSLDGIKDLTQKDLDRRFQVFRSMSHFD
jgi:cytidine kinase